MLGYAFLALSLLTACWYFATDNVRTVISALRFTYMKRSRRAEPRKKNDAFPDEEDEELPQVIQLGDESKL